MESPNPVIVVGMEKLLLTRFLTNVPCVKFVRQLHHRDLLGEVLHDVERSLFHVPSHHHLRKGSSAPSMVDRSSIPTRSVDVVENARVNVDDNQFVAFKVTHQSVGIESQPGVIHNEAFHLDLFPAVLRLSIRPQRDLVECWVYRIRAVHTIACHQYVIDQYVVTDGDLFD